MGGITERTTKNDSGLARFSYIAQMRNTIQKESVQGKIFIDMEKFNTIIKKYCDLLKEKKEIKKEDIMRIESQKKNESKLKHRMKKKSPDLAGLLKKSILEKNKISKNSKPKDSIVPENNKTAIYNIPTLKTMTSTYDTMDDSLSIEEIFGMSSTLSKAKNDSHLEEKSKLNEESIEEEINIFTHIPTASYKINEDFNALTATTQKKDISNLVTFEQKIKKVLNSEDGILIGE